MAEIAKKMFEIHENPIDIIDVYGPTECCVDVSYYIVDEKGNIISRNGEKGELVVLGKQVGAGYTSGENDKFTFGSDVYDNTYHTGDVAVLNEYGQIIVLGRVDNQVKKNGYRIELDEIAIQIKGIDKIKSVVVRKRNYNDVEKIVAFIGSDKIYLENELLEEVKKVVPQYMVSDIIIQMEEIPTNINGKVDEKKMDEYYEAYKMLKARGNDCQCTFFSDSGKASRDFLYFLITGAGISKATLFTVPYSIDR